MIKGKKINERTKIGLIKPGEDYYSKGFTVCLLILTYFLLFFSKMTGRRGSLSETLDNNSQFSGDLVIVLLLIILWIILDRMICTMRPVISKNDNEFSQNTPKKEEKNEISTHSMLIKLILHVFLVIFVHVTICFQLPYSSKVFFIDNAYLCICYILFCFYFYFSAMQIKCGYPEIQTGQIFTENTELFNRLAFRSNN